MALVPQQYLDSLVALEQPTPPGETPRAVATGFLVGFDSGDKDEEEQTLYRTFLVTNRHVVEGGSKLVAKFNRGDEAARYDIELLDGDGNPNWVSHGEFDIAVIPVGLVGLRDEGAEFAFVTDENMLDLDKMDELQVGAGYSVFVLGFPMGLAGVQRKYAIVRTGHIARIDRELINDPDYRGYLLDSTVYPGNSGGPVVLAPNAIVLDGSPVVNTLYVIGVVASYMPYSDTAVSLQTGNPASRFRKTPASPSQSPWTPSAPRLRLSWNRRCPTARKLRRRPRRRPRTHHRKTQPLRHQRRMRRNGPPPRRGARHC
jgi:hypothetical protein